MSDLFFFPFRLDPVAERLWREEEPVALRPKAIAVLRYLIEQRERIVPQEELRQAVWPDVVVSQAVLKVCIQEIRAALNDDVRTPRFIVTAPRRGYRFIASLLLTPPVISGQFSVLSTDKAGEESWQLATGNWQLTTHLVGREAELTHLSQWLEYARQGERQIVLVSGEPGIGKTTLVDAFVSQLIVAPDVWVARGQCIEHYGASEAYLPMLEALEDLLRQPRCKSLVAVLNQQAPTWLAQLPAFHGEHGEIDQPRLQRHMLNATPERMLREMATALEVLTADNLRRNLPLLVLVLEDLHWSDYSTLDLLSAIAQRRGTAKLLLIGTYRPVDVLATAHPLRTVAQELRRHYRCHELPLAGLDESAVAAYLTARFPGKVTNDLSLQEWARALHQRTEGHPLFLVSVVDDLVNRRLLDQERSPSELYGKGEFISAIVPDNLRESVATQVERLPSEAQQILEAASIAGMECTTAAVAVALDADLVAVEEHCARFARQQLFLQPVGAETWPDGTVTTRYRFRHSLHQNMMYDRVTAVRRLRLHQRIGERTEAGYGSQTNQISAELARHFEQGRDFRRAVPYLGQAAQSAMHKHAYREAIDLLNKAIQLLETWPETAERLQQELSLQITLGIALLMTRGFTAPETEAAYARAHTLCQYIGEDPRLFPVLEGLQTFYAVRGELPKAHILAEQMLTLARQTQTSSLLLEAHHVIGDSFLMQAEFTRAHAHLEQAIALYDPQQHSAHAFMYSGHDPGVCCLGYEGFVLWDLGRLDQSLRQSQRAIALAREIAHPYSQAMAFFHNAYLHYLRREGPLTQKQAEAAMAIGTEHGFPDWIMTGMILRGWALAQQGQVEEGLAQIRQGMAACQAMGVGLGWSGMAFQLADACGKAGRHEEGLHVLEEALVKLHQTGELCYETELHRLKGELTLQQESQKSKSKSQKSKSSTPQHPTPSTQAEAEGYFLKAIEIARQKEAKSLELRAALDLSRLWKQQGKKKKARHLLGEIYPWFVEGLDTPDLREARMLLATLA
jgi:DNA-binding winged helix-turn-helix (wHTH) protein/predicted ATPase